MRCYEIFDTLVIYADGELDAERITEVEQHLSACSMCRQRLEKLQIIERGIQKSLSEPVEAPDLTESIMERLPNKRMPVFPKWVLGWASGLIMGLIFGLFFRTSVPNTQSTYDAHQHYTAQHNSQNHNPVTTATNTQATSIQRVVTVTKIVYRDRYIKSTQHVVPILPHVQRTKELPVDSRHSSLAKAISIEQVVPRDLEQDSQIDISPETVVINRIGQSEAMLPNSKQVAYVLPPYKDAETIERPPLPMPKQSKQSGL